MQQNIYTILLFSICTIGVFYICPQKSRPTILFLESMIFYIICDYKFVLLILSETIISWFFGKKIFSCRSTIKDNKKGKKWLWCAIIFILFILCFFKYFNFFIDCFNLSFANIILPIGISYYSFKIISYVVDIYLNRRDPESSFITYSVYILFFPHLICGPIVRSTSITDRIHEGLNFDKNKFSSGIIRIIYGFFMKTVIADRAGSYVSTIFSTPDNFPSIALILALFLYAIQLYCDFAGYSLIAQGITNCFGFECMSNFKRPYLSLDIRDFWRRWHISLSSWLRDYIYIPLGGNRCSLLRKWCNVFITFIVCGIWHGNSLHFILWGIYHGLLNNLTLKKSDYGKIGKYFMWIFTMILVLFGWLLFRSTSISYIFHFISRIFTNFSLSYSSITASIIPFTGDNTAIAYAITLFFMISLLFVKEIFDEKRERRLLASEKTTVEESFISSYTLFWSILFFVLIILFGITGSSNFLYANF